MKKNIIRGGGGLINFLPLKRGGAYLREGAYLRGGGLIEDLWYSIKVVC